MLKQKRLLYQISITVKTYFKRKTICVDLIMINSSSSFQNKITFEMEFSHLHKLVITVLKLYFPKQKPKVVS